MDLSTRPSDPVSESGPRAGDIETALAVGLAAACFARTFRGPRSSFWRRMTGTGAVLGAVALAREPSLRSVRPRPRHLVEGGIVAGGLYAIFRAGDAVARRVMPDGAGDIDDIYALRVGHDPSQIAARLALVIGPAEELFWRGFVQRRLARDHGRWGAAARAASAYAGVHLAAGNPTLVGAAGVAGAYWSVLAAAGVDMESLVVSHVLWDIVIFLVAPTARSGTHPVVSSGALSRRVPPGAR